MLPELTCERTFAADSIFMPPLCRLAAFLCPLYVLPARLFPNVTRQHHSDGRSPNPGHVSYQGGATMSVKGRNSRHAQHKSTDRGQSLKAIFKPRRAFDREHSPTGKMWGARRAPQLLAGAFAQSAVDTACVEDGCARCGLEPRAWKGHNGKGYPRGGEWYCCQMCADELECPCQG